MSSLNYKIIEELKKEKLDQYIQNLTEQELVELFYNKPLSFLDGIVRKSKIYRCKQQIKNMFGEGSVITASYPSRNITFKITRIQTRHICQFDEEVFEMLYMGDKRFITFTFDDKYELTRIDGVSIIPGMIKFSN